MWLKSAVRQLAKWVPTSAEYRKEQLRAAQEVLAERAHATPSRIVRQADPDDGHVDPLTGEVFDDDPDDIHEAELVDQPDGAMFPQEARR